jgi:hypothetical protein
MTLKLSHLKTCMKKFLLLIILNLSLLLSPPPVKDDCSCGKFARYIHLTSFAGFTLNPDTYGYIFPAIDPGLLLKKQSQRQSRPLFILSGTAVGYSLFYITKPIHKWLYPVYKKFYTGTYPLEKMFITANFYIAFLLINITILWLSLFLFEKICTTIFTNEKLPVYAMYTLMVFIASNPVTKVFFWTVHQQMFTFFTPLFCIYILLTLIKKESLLKYKSVLLLSLASGILLLVYGSFILLLPVLIFGFCNNYLLFNKYNLLYLLLKNLLLIMLFALPSVAWILILKKSGVTYYNFEITEYRQLIWIKDSLTTGTFWKNFLENTLHYIATLKYIFSFLAAFFIVLFATRIKLFKYDMAVKGTLFIFLSFFLFYWILGFYQERLSYTLIPIILCLFIIFCKEELYKKKMVYILCSFAVCWHLYVLLSYGPFC